MQGEHVPGGTHPVVLDTNVWISGALTRHGAPARVVRHVLEHAVPVFSPPTFAELETRLWLPKFDRYVSLELRRRILHDLSAAAIWVDIPPYIGETSHSRDPNDDMFIHTALAAKVHWLVTGDLDLLELSCIQDLQIVSPAAALQTDHAPWTMPE